MSARKTIPGPRKRGLKGDPDARRIRCDDTGLAISIVLPAHPSAAALVERTLLALDGQDFPRHRFEVIVCADGGDAAGRLAAAIAAQPRPYACRLIDSPRPAGDIAHRNHTRNAGCAAARGELVWPLDADFLLPQHALTHVWSGFLDRLEAGHFAVFTPCMAGVAIAPEQWLEQTVAALDNADATGLLRCAGEAPRNTRILSGYFNLYAPGAAASTRIPTLNEGMPVVPARIVTALGGFDEAFLGFGANKQEFVRRLVGLARSRLIEIRVLHSVLALHQPHHADVDKRPDSQRRRHNAALLARKLHDMRRNARWWSRQRDRARRVLGEWAKTTAPQRSRTPERLRVGIVSVNDPRKGLYRDTEILSWALAQGNEHFDAQALVSVFPVAGADAQLRTNASAAVAAQVSSALPDCVAAGTRFSAWLRDIDVLITLETWFDSAVQLAREHGKRVIYVPNLEWTGHGQPPDTWARQVHDSGTEVWAKTQVAFEALQAAGLHPVRIAWSIPDTVVTDRLPRSGPVRLLMLAGMGGWRNRRGLDIALRAFALARQHNHELCLTVHSVKPLQDYPDNPLIGAPGITATEGLLPRARLAELMQQADIMLYPSRWEGFGLSLLEGLHAGLPILATDGAPMNELVEHEHNGLLVYAKHAPRVRLAPAFECQPAALAEAITRLAGDGDLRRRLTCPEPGELTARQYRFVNEVGARVRDSAPRRVVVFCGPPSPGVRRSERFWNDALQNHGFEVNELGHDASTAQLRAHLQCGIEFVLVGKVPPVLLRQIRASTSVPVVLWHHDLTDYTRARHQWFRKVAPLCDLVAVPERGRELCPDMTGRMITLFPGVNIDGDRGPGRRPRWPRQPCHDNELVFLGRLNRRRASLLRACARVAHVRVHGHPGRWRLPGIKSDAPVWGVDAARAMRRATYVLSVSERDDIHYTSNRLFNSAGAGACVVAKRFPGIEDLYPSESLALFDDAREVPRLLRRLCYNRTGQRALRLAAEEHTWRHHTWNDRIRMLLMNAAMLRGPPIMEHKAEITLPRYWNERAAKRGARAAGFHSWDDQVFATRTEQAWQDLIGRLGELGHGAALRVLDFGCGPGRFTHRLASLGHAVTGVDISREMLSIARKSAAGAGCRFLQIDPGGTLPFDDGEFDCLWTFTVLQHIPDTMFMTVASELRRVLNPDGFVCLFENTHRHHSRTSRSGHVVFRSPEEYIQAFPGIAPVTHTDLERERHSLISGRLG